MDVKLWWVTLSVISVLNILAWFYSAWLFNQRKAVINPAIYRGRRVILWMSGIYVIVCAFRSFLPRIDLERICLVDSWLSNVLLGRSITTVAELSFIMLCVVLLREAGRGTNDRFSLTVSILLIVLIMAAEGFSWYAAITTHYLGSVIEESLWTVAGALLIASFISLRPHVSGRHKHFLNAMIIFCTGYLVFMITVDVPMYWARWQADTAMAVEYLSLKQGIADAAKACSVNYDWEIWREEIPWMTLYFTVAVWLSIYLTHAPDFKIKQAGTE
jgi:hypothetical protein